MNKPGVRTRYYPWHRRRLRLLIALVIGTVVLSVLVVLRIRLNIAVERQVEEVMRSVDAPALSPHRKPSTSSGSSEHSDFEFSSASMDHLRELSGRDDETWRLREALLLADDPCAPAEADVRTELSGFLGDRASLLVDIEAFARVPEPLDEPDVFLDSATRIRSGVPERLELGDIVHQSMRVLELRALYAVERGDRDGFLGALQSMHTLTMRRRDCLGANVQCNRLSWLTALPYLLPKAFCSLPLTDEDLARMQAWIAAEQSPDSFKLAMLGERMAYLGFVGNIAPEDVKELVASDPLLRWVPGKERTCLFAAEVIGWNDYDRHGTLGLFEQLVAAGSMAPPACLARLEEIRSETSTLLGRWRTAPRLSDMAVGIAECVFVRDAVAECTRVGLGVERYRMARGKLPERLEQLSPGYLDTPCTDPFTGGPLQYRVEDKRYTVYSVGPNGQNDIQFPR